MNSAGLKLKIVALIFLLEFFSLPQFAVSAPMPPRQPPGNNAPPPLPPGTNPPPLPPPGVCARDPLAADCPPHINPPENGINRLRGTNNYNSFNYEGYGQAPGIAEYERLGYCTGIVENPKKIYSQKKGLIESEAAVIRKYYFVITQHEEPKSAKHDKVPFLKISMSSGEGKPCGNLSHFNPKELTKKNRAVNAPPLFFNEGETAEIHIRNTTESEITIHWHGLILPNGQDGVPNLTQKPIPAGAGDFIYRFDLKQNGTYWYHPHDLNEQHTKGAFIIFPKTGEEMITRKFSKNPNIETRYHHDRILFLSDYKKKSPLLILNQLRDDRNTYSIDSEAPRGFIIQRASHYSDSEKSKNENFFQKLFNIWDSGYDNLIKNWNWQEEIKRQIACGKEYWDNTKKMGMPWMDKADVWYDSFFINDETCLNCGEQAQEFPEIEPLHQELDGQDFPELAEFNNIKVGDRVRLRIINGSGSTFFFVDYGNNSRYKKPNEKTDMLVVAKDGQPVDPIYTDQLSMGPGETYDVIVDVPESNTSYELRIKSIDDFFNTRLARVLIGDGNNLKLAHDVPVLMCQADYDNLPQNEDLPNQLIYSDMTKRTEPGVYDPFPYAKNREVVRYDLALSGNMTDYYWRIDGINGTKPMMDRKNNLKYLTLYPDKKHRFKIENNMLMGMMNHPLHLHGMFFKFAYSDEIEGLNDLQIDDLMESKPLLHTVTLSPSKTGIIEIYADPELMGSWMFHCHNLYHMANQMMMYLKYDKYDNPITGHGRSSHGGHQAKGDDSEYTYWDGVKDMNSQYVSAWGGAHAGTRGQGIDAYINYRGNLGGDLGYVDASIGASKNVIDNKDLNISSKIRVCKEVNKCVYLNLSYEATSDTNTSQVIIGKTHNVYNSEILVFDGGAGMQCEENRETHAIKCAPALAASGSASVALGLNTNGTLKVGCEGAYCTEVYAEISAKMRAHPNVTFTLFDCKASTNKEETGCFTNIMFGSDPKAFGKYH